MHHTAIRAECWVGLSQASEEEIVAMTTIKVTCPECGDIDLTPIDLQLTVTAEWATYEFTCSECGDGVSKPADSEIVDLLSSAGVPSLVIPREAFERHRGPSISYDDLLDAGLLLGDDARWAAELAGIAHEATLGAPDAEPLASPGRRRRRLSW